MSRAFVKENDLEHAGIDIPERPLSDAPNYVTPRGLSLLNHSIDDLEKEREALITKKDDPMVRQKIAMIERDMRYVRQKIAVIERDMRYFAARIESAILTNPKEKDPTHVLFGAKVTVEDEEGTLLIFEIVGEDEANIHEGRVSYLSPLASALLGGAVGDEVVWEKPVGNSYLTIQKISY